MLWISCGDALVAAAGGITAGVLGTGAGAAAAGGAGIGERPYRERRWHRERRPGGCRARHHIMQVVVRSLQ